MSETWLPCPRLLPWNCINYVQSPEPPLPQCPSVIHFLPSPRKQWCPPNTSPRLTWCISTSPTTQRSVWNHTAPTWPHSSWVWSLYYHFQHPTAVSVTLTVESSILPDLYLFFKNLPHHSERPCTPWGIFCINLVCFRVSTVNLSSTSLQLCAYSTTPHDLRAS